MKAKLVKEHITSIFDGKKEILNKRTGTYIIKEKTNIIAVNKAVISFLNKNNIEFIHEKSRTTNSNYYTIYINNDLNVNIRVSDHSKAIRYNINDYKTIDYDIFIYTDNSILITLNFNIDGVNYNINDLKKDFYNLINESNYLINITNEIISWSINNINNIVNNDGFIDINKISNKFNISQNSLGKQYLTVLLTKISNIPIIKDKLINIRFDLNPVGNLSSYVASNGVYIDTFNKRDPNKWQTRLPQNVNKYITSQMSNEQKKLMKKTMRQNAIEELDLKLKALGK